MTSKESDRRWKQALNDSSKDKEPAGGKFAGLDAIDREAETQGRAIGAARRGRTMTCRGKKTRAA